MDITKPEFDLRNYTGGKLTNNIKYIIINDSTLDRTFISVNIKAGSYDEPKGYDGLAHFLEHMLFMGSEKYPKENHFNDTVVKYSGETNAYTSYEETCYYIQFDDGGFDDIIEIFSRFFIDPLFLKDSVDREMNAVNNEHLKNINDDNWIFNQFINNISSNRNIFATGNLDTLNKPDIREKMIEFYKKYYIVQNISICVATNIDANKVHDKLNSTFGKIKPIINYNDNDERIIFKEKGSCYYLKSIRDNDRLAFLWEIPEQYSSGQYKTQEFNILGNLLTVNIEKSLHFTLRNAGLINSMSTSVNTEGYFQVFFNMTPLGFKSLDIIETMMNSFLEMIYQMDFNKVIEYYNKLNSINFNYLNKIDSLDLCIFLASNRHHYRLKNVFITSTIIEPSNDHLALYRKYIRPDNQIKILITQEYPGHMIAMDHYNSSYAKIDLPNYQYDAKYFDELKVLPLTNSLVDIKPVMLKNMDKFKIPKKLRNYWYGGISEFNEPTIYFKIIITNDFYCANPANYLMTMISCRILNYLLSIRFFEAFSIGYSASFIATSSLSSIILSGYGLNDMKVFISFINDLLDFTINIADKLSMISHIMIDSIITQVTKIIQNEMYSTPAQYNKYILAQLTNPNEFSDKVLLEELKKINSNTVKEYMTTMFNKDSQITNIFYGAFLELRSLRPSYYFKTKKEFDLPKIMPFWSCNDTVCPIVNKTIAIMHPDTKQKSSSVMFYYNVGEFNAKNVLLLCMVIDLFADKFFDSLRTKQQLGYLVKMSSSIIMNTYAIVQQIQSDKSHDKVIKAIEDFNITILSFIKKSEMGEYKTRIRNTLKIKDNNTAEVFSRYSSEIINRTYMFDRKEVLLNQIKRIDFSDLVDFIKKVINKDNCIKIIVKGH